MSTPRPWGKGQTARSWRHRVNENRRSCRSKKPAAARKNLRTRGPLRPDHEDARLRGADIPVCQQTGMSAHREILCQVFASYGYSLEKEGRAWQDGPARV